MSTHDWMTPYYYDTGDFVELRKAYEAIDGDFAVIEDATDSRKNPTLWKRMDIDDFLITVGGYTKDEVSDPYLTDELARQEVYNIMRGEFGFMNEARFIEDVKRVWHTPFTYREYTYSTETARTIVSAIIGDMVRSLGVGSVPAHESLRPLRYITDTSFQYTSPFTYDAETRELRVKGDFRGYNLTTLWVREDPILSPASGQFELADIEQVRKDGEYTIITVTTDTADAVADIIPTLKKPVVYITIPMGVELKVPMTLDLDTHRLAFWSQAAVGSNAIINIEFEAIDSTERTLTELDDIVEVSVNCQQNISVTVSTQWDYGVSQFDTLVEHIHDRFPAGVRLLLDAYRDIDSLEIGVGAVLQITTQQDMTLGEWVDYTIPLDTTPYIGFDVFGWRLDTSIQGVADKPSGSETRDFGIERMMEVTEHLHEISYLDYDWRDADDLIDSGYAPMASSLGGCTSLTCTDASRFPYHVRNYDWYYNTQEEYIIHTSADTTKGRMYSTIGVATGMPALNDETTIADADATDPLYHYLPFMTVDGMNDEGLCINMNVAPTNDVRYDLNESSGTITRYPYGRYSSMYADEATYSAHAIMDDFDGTNATEGARRLSALMVCRYVLDTCATLNEVEEALVAANVVPFKTKSGHIENLHYMVSSKAAEDADRVCMIIELFDGMLVFIDTNGTRIYKDGAKIHEYPGEMINNIVHYEVDEDFISPYWQDVQPARSNGYVCLTNFWYNCAITKYAVGVERQMAAYGWAYDRDRSVGTVDFPSPAYDLVSFVSGLKYSQAYDMYNQCPWYSEFHSEYSSLDFSIDTPIDEFISSPVLPAIVDMFENRSRETGLTWHTMHSVLYDRENLAMWLCVQERVSRVFFRDMYGNNEYGMSLREGATRGKVDKLRIAYDEGHSDAQFRYEDDRISLNSDVPALTLGASNSARNGG